MKKVMFLLAVGVNCRSSRLAVHAEQIDFDKSKPTDEKIIY